MALVFFAQPDKPERAILADPAAWYGAHAPGKVAALGEENHADHLAAMHDPDTVRAMLEDYRAGLGGLDDGPARRRPDRQRAPHGRGRSRGTRR